MTEKYPKPEVDKSREYQQLRSFCGENVTGIKVCKKQITPTLNTAMYADDRNMKHKVFNADSNQFYT